MSERYEQMTVLELRKVAKELGVKLGAGISKQGIIDKLLAAGNGEAEPAAMPAEEMHPVRKAAIILDDESDDPDDIPVLTARMTPRTAPQPRVPASGTVSSLSTISAKAPAFTMEGSRAWHNPRPYSNTPYQRPQQNTWNPRPAASGSESRDYSRPSAPRQTGAPVRPSSPYPQRFGPEQTEPQDYRTSYAPAPQQDYLAPRGDYAPSAAYSNQPYYRKESQDRPAQMNQPNMSEMMMTGECGDGEGNLEMQPEGYGLLRNPNGNGKNDIYISAAQIRRFSLRPGDHVTGKTRPQRESDRYCAMLYITEINGMPAEDAMNRVTFENLTPVYPKKRIRFSGPDEKDPFLCAMDLLCPMGFGQRALITAPARSGKTTLIRKMSAAIRQNYPQAEILILLLGERPEDVTEMKDQVNCEVAAAPADQSDEALIRLSEMTLERVERMVEQKKDVVLFTDNLTRLGKALNQTAPAGTRTLQTGLAAGCLTKARRFFGAARNTREAGSLTIIAIQQAPGGNALEEAISEEFRGISNMEMTLQRLPGEKRILPAFIPASCVNRREDMLLSPEETEAKQQALQAFSGKTPAEQMDMLCRLPENSPNAASETLRADQ